MRCHEYEDLLQGRLDGQPIEADGLEQHLTECPSCRQLAQVAKSFEEGLKQLSSPVPPANLRGRIVAAVLADRHKPSVSTTRPMWAAVALAASILILALGVNAWFPQESTSKPTFVKRQEKASNVEVMANKESPSLRKSFTEASDAVTNLTASLAGETRKQAELFWKAAGPENLSPIPDLTPDRLSDSLYPAAASLQETGKGVSEGFVTVAKSAQQAVSYFVRGLTN